MEGLRVDILMQVTGVKLTTYEEVVKSAFWAEDHLQRRGHASAEAGKDYPGQTTADSSVVVVLEIKTGRIDGALSIPAAAALALCTMWAL